jgi:hypothetical protein
MAYTTATAWSNWTATSSATTASSDTSAWVHWMDDGTGGSTAATTWQTWTSSTTTGTYIVDASCEAWSGQVETRKLTRAERKEQRKRQAEAEEVRRLRQQEDARLAREAQAKREAASKRAEALLLSHLSEEQEKAWKEERAIFVTSQSGKRFKIKHGRAHNIFELDDKGLAIREYCVHVQPSCPDADNVLAQKLMLEHREDELMRIANKWDLAGGRRV